MLGLRSDCPNDTLGYNHCPVFYRVEEGADRTYLTKVKYATSYRVTNSHF